MVISSYTLDFFVCYDWNADVKYVNVYLYNKSVIAIGEGCVISRSVFLCTASHDYSSPHFTLFSKPIFIAPFSWIAASSIIMPGLSVSEGSVIGAGSVLTKSTDPWSVYAGNPAIYLKKRHNFLLDS
jgi:putative colanic acid biosynthesis acetyltransferase WcaF